MVYKSEDDIMVQRMKKSIGRNVAPCIFWKKNGLVKMTQYPDPFQSCYFDRYNNKSRSFAEIV